MVDQYRVRRLVGRGGMGAVYLARDVRLGRKVALKVIGGRMGQAAVEDFLREARVTARFNHPHIVTVYGAGEVDGAPYLALEYLEGTTLRAQLETERLPLARALRVALAVAEALAEAHGAGVLHRDLKPENVFLPRDGRVRVVDFGLARSVGADEIDAARPLDTQLAGTPLYMAPEQWRNGTTSAASDVWAFGLCLFEMLSGGHPFAGDGASVARLRAALLDPDLEPPPLPEAEAVPAEVAALVRSCLDPDPARRPAARQLVAQLDRALHGGSDAADEEAPYRGLLPFTEEHAAQFFGRDAELAGVVERLRLEATLAVVGPSGAGKSSFVLAGIVPRLREDAWWLVVTVRPGRDPFGTLATKLVAKESVSSARVGSAETVEFGDTTGNLPALSLAIGVPRRSPAELAAYLQVAPAALHLVLREIAEEQRCNVLLVVDQLEELYTLVDDEQERRAFMTALCAAADDPDDPVRVVLTVRDDFLGRLADTPAAADALARVVLMRPLGREALRETLVRPLQARGYRFDDPALPDRMVEAVADSGAALPLLQFAARMLWDRRDTRNRLLRARDYEQIGGVAGALARHADDVLAALAEGQRENARQLLLRLVTGEGTRRGVPWAEALDGLPPGAEATLERLVAARLLTVREGAGGAREVELAHESLIRSWGRLRRWHAESREEVRVLEELEDAARLWEKRGRRSTELWAGETLFDAERVLRGAEIPMSGRAAVFLDAAVALRDRAKRNRRLIGWGAAAALASVAVGASVAALAYARQRQAAMDQAAAAEDARAEALVAGAQAAWASGDALAARAQLRSALALRDSPAARALWSRLRTELVQWSLDTPYWPYGYAVSADGNRVAVGTSDGILRSFDLRTGEVRGYPTTGEGVATVALSPGGQLAAVSFDGPARVWPADGGAPRELPGVPDATYPYHLDFLSEDVLQLYMYRPESFDTLRLTWDLRTSDAPAMRPGTQGHGRMAVSPDGRWLVSGNPRGGAVALVDLRDDSARTLGVLDGGARLGRLAFTPDGARVAAVGRQVWIWPIAGGDPVTFTGMAASVRAAGFLPDGSLAALGEDGQVRIWDGAGALVRELRIRFDGDPQITGGEVTPRGQLYVNREVGLMLVDLVHGRAAHAGRGHVGFVEGLAVSADGSLVASSGQDGSVRLWSVDGTEQAVLTEAGGPVGDVELSADGKWLAAGSDSGDALIWSIADRVVARRLPHGRDVKGVAFTPDGASLITGDYAGQVRRWDLAALDGGAVDVGVTWTLPLHTNVFDLALLPEGDRFVASDFYGGVHTGVVGAATARRFDGHKTQCHTVVPLAGHRALSLGFDDVAKLWDLDAGAVIAELPVEGNAGIAVSPDGEGLARTEGERLRIGPFDGSGAIDAWGVEGAGNLAFSPDGATLYAGDHAGTIRAIEVATGFPRWATRFVQADPPLWLTHRGWEGEAPQSAWARWLAADGLRAADAGDTLCAIGRDGVVRWDRPADREAARAPANGAVEVAAIDGGCLVRAGTEIRDPTGSVHPGSWSALAPQPGGGAVLISDDRVAWIDRAGAERATFAVGAGTTAARIAGDRVWLGRSDGSLAVRALPSGEALPMVALANPPASPVTAVAPGPGGTVFAGHYDGHLVLWDLRSGAPLLQRKLHGPVIGLVARAGELVAVTEVGDVERVDLSVFEADRCAVLRDVEAAVPTVWQGDRVVLAEGPARCE